MRENVEHYGKWIQLLFAAALMVCAGLTLHDMQMAEGTGLYLALKAGAQDRRAYDLLVDCVGMCCLLALLLLPCILQKRLGFAPFLRFGSACLAFLPVMSTGALVHLADGTGEIAFRQAILEGRLAMALREGLAGLAPILAAGVPLLLLALGVAKTGIGQDQGKGVPALPRAFRATGAFGLGLLAVGLLFPALTDICAYLIVYLLLVYAFSLWEKLHDEIPGLNAWGWILFGGFWLRAIERMLEVMSIYHL